jgi:uncharacterized protein
MQLDFDPVKSHLNFLKHGLSLAFAQRLDWEDGLIWPDLRKTYAEPRMSAWCPPDSSCILSPSLIENLSDA